MEIREGYSSEGDFPHCLQGLGCLFSVVFAETEGFCKGLTQAGCSLHLQRERAHFRCGALAASMEGIPAEEQR